MKSSSAWIATSVIAAVAGLGLSSMAVKPAADAVRTAAPAAAADSAAQTCQQVQRVLSGFFAVKDDALATPCTPAGAPAPPALRAGVHVILATLPDPVHTHLPLMFDRHAEAIQQAAQDSKYTYDSSWLPWQTGRADSSSAQDQDLAAERTDRREDQPGVLLFRKSLNADTSSPTSVRSGTQAGGQTGGQASAQMPDSTAPYKDGLIVFIVGEEATGGIHRDQFKNAAKWIRSLQLQGISTQDVALLGPSFSGSLPSLAELLQDADVRKALMPASGAKLKIYSGQVTNNIGVAWLNAQLNPVGVPNAFDFLSFQQDDDTTLKRFYHYLDGVGMDTNRFVSIVSEDETAYGWIAPKCTLELARAPRMRKEAVEPPCSPADETLRRNIASFYYPRDISALRAAYQKQSIFAPTTTPSTDSSSTELQNDVADTGDKQHDTVRSFGGSQTALSQEAVLLQIVSMLRAHQSQIVILRSSNPVDQLFLAHFFKRAYPEGRIVTLGNDLLLRREVGSGGLSGILTLSNYPLLASIDDWTSVSVPPVHSHRAFTQDGSQGTYTAARALLTANHCPLTSATGFLPDFCDSPPDVPPDYAPPFWLSTTDDARTPSTWLTVLGNNGFWPIAAFSDKYDGGGSKRPTLLHHTSDRVWAPPPLSMKIFIVGILLWALVHAVCCAAPSITVKPDHRSYFARVKRADCRHATYSHAALIAVSSALLVNVATTVAWGCGFMAWRDAPMRHPRSSVLFPIAVWLITGFGIVFNAWIEHRLNGPDAAGFAFPSTLYPSQWRHEAGEALAAAWRRLCVFTAMTAGYGLALWILLDSVQRPETRTFTYIRAMNLTTGVSPVLPLVLLALGMYGWCWYSLKSLALFGPGKPLLPSKAGLQLTVDDKSLDILTMLSEEGAAEPLETYAEPFHWRTWVAFAIVFIGLVVGALFMGDDAPLRSLGNQRYSRAVCIWIAISISLLLSNLWQLTNLWLKLRSILMFLDKLPLRRTLQAISGFSWGSIWQLGGNVLDVRYQLFYRQFETLNHFEAALKDYVAAKPLGLTAAQPSGFDLKIKAAHDARETFSTWYAAHWDDWKERDLSSLSNVQAQAAVVVGALMTDFLVPAWRTEKGSLTTASPAPSGSDGESKTASSLHPEAYVRNAEEVVCLLYLGFILNILGRLRSLVIGMTFLYLSIALVLPSYPFDPRPVLTGAVIILFLLIGLVVFMVYSQMFRDATLSHLTNTKPGILGSAFWMKFAAVGAGPLFGLLATVFPGLGSSVLSWLQPSLAALK